MMKLLERRQNHDVRRHEFEDLDHHDLEGVQVPDDISGLESIPSIGEPHRAARTVRWLRWMPALLAVSAAALVTAVLVSDSPQSEVAPMSDFELVGPGSHSLGPIEPRVYMPDFEHDGPGSHSLDHFNG